MSIKVLMLPHLSHFRTEESGIKRVVEAYFKYLPQFDVELVDKDATSYDLAAVHAGMSEGECDICHLHGLYWTADYHAPSWEYEANRRIVEAVRRAKQITVPSAWVAETFQRDLRVTPHVIGHGIDWDEWQHEEDNEGYVLWNKNRAGADVCVTDALDYLAEHNPETEFVSTFGKGGDNVTLTRVIPHDIMKRMIQRAGVYLSSTKETFGIGILEAMAAGIPVLGWAHGGNVDLVQHGVNGYLAEPGNYQDLQEGLNYCLKYRKTLGANGQEMAKAWTWEAACERVAEVYRLAIEGEPSPSVSVVIPVYNKTIEQVGRALESAKAQTLRPKEIVIVNDGSDPSIYQHDKINLSAIRLIKINQPNQGVAHARNNGIAQTTSKYICCLDADDWIEPTFLQLCVERLEEDRSLGITYTGLRWHRPDGETGVSQWPPQWDYDKFFERQNQVPTCNVFRREMWERLGGYRQRYAPQGAGAEDAEFWLRSGAYGWGAEKVTNEPLFNYWAGGTVGGNPDYQEVDWLAWHPWTRDSLHPFASYATPNKKSHPVRQYDEPIVSVIIPVGPGHEKTLINALDSLEAQTFRRWEVIVIDDTGISDELDEWYVIRNAYPYIRWVETNQDGAGYARNRGTEIARAPFLLFLDADDTLHPDALTDMIEAWNRTGHMIYTDYVGMAIISEEYAEQLEDKGRLQTYDTKTGEAVISFQSADFDCARAIRQPEPDGNFYIWNLITTLIPRQWHLDIGGFDEKMETWEDWDYWIRLARAGYCFSRIDKELVGYRFQTGNRRTLALPDTEQGRQTAQAMIKYLREKYSRSQPVGCGCQNGVNGNAVTATAASEITTLEEGKTMAQDSEFIKARYIGSRGNHHVTGATVFDKKITPQMKVAGQNQWRIYYGYISNGDVRLVHKDDFRLMIGKWQQIEKEAVKPEIKREPLAEPAMIATAVNPAKLHYEQKLVDPPAVYETDGPLDLQTIPGVTGAIAKRMTERRLTTIEAIKAAGIDELMTIKGIAEARAKMIMAFVNK